MNHILMHPRATPAAPPPDEVEIDPAAVARGPSGPAWDEAFLRVESYLHAHQVESRVLLNQLVLGIIREAGARAGANPREDPVVAAMAVTHARIGAWLARAGYAGDWSDERVRAGGRLALVLADLPESWAQCFLSSGPVPPALVTALATGVLQSGPALCFSNMAAAPLEFSFADHSDPNKLKNGGWAHMRAAAGWLAIVGLYGAAWAASH